MKGEKMAKKIGKMSKGWWLYLILGILATLFGIALFGNMALAITTVAVIAGIYFLVSGIFGAILTIVDRQYIHLWGLKLALHILVIIAGLCMLTRPAFALSFLWFICGFGFLFDGISMIILSLEIKKANVGSWVLLLILGILVALAALSIMGNPILGLAIVAISAAISAIVFGVSNIVYAFQIKKLG